MKYYFPLHLDGDNRGCEAIAKGTAILLDEKKDVLYGLCRNVSVDKKLGTDKYVTLIEPIIPPFYKRLKNKVIRTFDLPLQQSIIDPSLVFLSTMQKDDIMISFVGYMMCFGNNNVITTTNYVHSRGIKSILWGCSMGEENLTPEKKKTLHNFSLIYARESLSYKFFKDIGLTNVCLFPDPAFILKPEKCNLPQCFVRGNDIVGINLSNYVIGGFSLGTPFGKEISKLLDYIVRETNYHVLIIPHVVWDSPSNRQNDKVVAAIVMQRYGYTGRFSVMDVDNLNYSQIRYIISKCKMFIGCRTHSVISAYATCVPTLALGYSIKSKGIAKDIGLSDRLVIDSRKISYTGYLIDAFRYVDRELIGISQHLRDVIPVYIDSTYGIRDVLKHLLQ